MTTAPDPWLATRTSLLHRLRDAGDSASWGDFCDAYGRVLHAVARRSGLTPEDAEDVVQETLVIVARKIGAFEYDRERGTFKSWILTITRRRIVDRQRQRGRERRREAPQGDADDAGTPLLERLPDERAADWDRIWAEEWQRGLYEAAREKVRSRVSARQFQIFDCSVTRGWEVERVVADLGVTANQVYIARHRVGEAIAVEVRRMERGELDAPGSGSSPSPGTV